MNSSSTNNLIYQYQKYLTKKEGYKLPSADQLSKHLSTLVIWINHYSGYCTQLKVFDRSKLLLDFVSTADSNEEVSVVEKFVCFDDRFSSIHRELSKLQTQLSSDSQKIISQMSERQLIFYDSPELIFNCLNLSFSDLYEIKTEELPEILVFKEY